MPRQGFDNEASIQSLWILSFVSLLLSLPYSDFNRLCSSEFVEPDLAKIHSFLTQPVQARAAKALIRLETQRNVLETLTTSRNVVHCLFSCSVLIYTHSLYSEACPYERHERRLSSESGRM